MSTIKVAAVNHPSASSGGLAISTTGNVTGGGLDLIVPGSIAYSGGTASVSGGAVAFTGVTSVSLNGVFSSTYDNYRIVARWTGSTSQEIRLRLRLSGTDASGATDYRYAGARSGSGADAVTGVDRSDGTNLAYIGYSTTAASLLAYDVCNPALATATLMLGGNTYTATFFNTAVSGVLHVLGTAYDGFSLFPSTGTGTGIVRVYGYKS